MNHFDSATASAGNASSTGRINFKVILSLTLLHFTGDFYSSFVLPLLPVLAVRFSLSLTQVGLITAVNRLLAFAIQPFSGYFADRLQTRFFILGGPLLAATFIPLIGIAPTYGVLIVFIALGSVGCAMFHPTCAGMVPPYAGRHLGLALSVFTLGGTLAFGVGPIFITTYVAAFGLQAVPLTLLLALPSLVYLFRVVPRPEAEGLRKHGFLGSLQEAFGEVWKPVTLLWLVMLIRSYVSQSFLTYVPLYLSQRGQDLVSVGLVVSLFTVAGALSGVLGGHLADRNGYRSVFYVSHLLSVPCLYLLLHLDGIWILPGAFLAGFFILATLPLGVALAQELAPKGRSMVSSLMMGLALGGGGMLAPVTGKLAELYSIHTTLSGVAMLPLLTLPIIGLITKNRSNLSRG